MNTTLDVTVNVEVDIFSGIENPHWAMTQTDIAEFQALHYDVQDQGAKNSPSHLGYRGFILSIYNKDQHVETLQVYNGTVYGSLQKGDLFTYEDYDRYLEKWLLEKSKSQLPADILQLIEKEFSLYTQNR